MKVNHIFYSTKLWRVMKICATQGMIAIVLCSVAMAHTGYSQLLEKEVSISVSNVSLEEALREISNKTKVKFAYSLDQLGVTEPVSIDAKRVPLQKVLYDLLSPLNISFKVHDHETVISLKKQESAKSREATNQADANAKKLQELSGKVTDIDGQPMPGVNVVVKGSTNGTSTDARGLYLISVEENDVLVFSFIGYRPVEQAVGKRVIMDIVLYEDVMNLGEVVVNAGYYKTTKATQTGNIGRMEGKEIQKQPVSNPLAAMQGRVSGLQIIQQTGVPGGNFQVRIRGQNSIANGNDPLYIVDGVPYVSGTMAFAETSQSILFNGTSPLNAINPNDIESIEVLKDADATAIYGSRGSNGVILITTKKGQSGETKVDFNMYAGSGRAASKMSLLNREQYLAMRNEALANDNIVPSEENAPDLLVWDSNRYTDWQRELLGGSANVMDAQLTVSGGDQYTQFSFGGGYHNEGTVFPGENSDRRISTQLSVNNVSKSGRFFSNISLKYSVIQTDLIKNDLTLQALTLSPVAPPLYDEEGELNWGEDNWSQSMPNPLGYTDMAYEATTKNMMINGMIGYSIVPNLDVKINLGYTDIGMDAITTTPLSALPPELAATSQNESVFSGSTFRNWMAEPQVNWKPALGKGRFDILLGMTFLDQVRDGLAQVARGFADEALMKNISAASTIQTATNYYSQYRYNAGFGRINYTYDNKYIINLTGRRDGSSRFGPGNQFANFGAVGVAWIFSEEEFIRNALSFLSFGKLRTSYGITGNDQLGDYQYLDTYTTSGNYNGVPGLKPTRLANPEFAWETNRKFEAGIELGFINNRIDTSISYYSNRSSEQLVGFALPPTTGFSTMQGNLPAVVQNTGVEIEINSTNVQKKDFSWTTSFNISFPRNELVEFPRLDDNPTYANTLVVGEPMTILKRYNYLQVDPVSGLYQFEDTNGDGSIDFADQQQIRFMGQDFFGGFLNTFRFKNFQLDLNFQFVKQTQLNYLGAFGIQPGGLSNQPNWVMERWQSENDQSNIQQFTTSDEGLEAYSHLAGSTRSMGDASFIRLKNVYLSYSLPSKWLDKAKLRNVRAFVQGQNLLTFTSYEGLDPETGTDFLPPLRVFSGGLNITF